VVGIGVVVVRLVLDVGEKGGHALYDVPVVGPHVGEVTQVVGDLRELDVFVASLGPEPLDLVAHSKGRSLLAPE